MTLSVKVSGAWKAVSALSIKKSGAWKLVSAVWIKEDGVWKLAFGAGGAPATLNATMQNGTVSGSRSDAGSVTSSSAVVLPTGGTPAYTYNWTRVSGDTYTITTATAANTTFSTTLTNGQTKSGVYRCTVTDSLGATATADVTVNMTSSYVAPGGGGGGGPPALSASASPGSVSGSRSGAGAVSSGGSSISASGGSGSYSYSWSGSGCTADNPSSASSTFSATLTNGQTLSASASWSVSSTDGQSAGGSISVNLTSSYVAPPSAPSVTLNPDDITVVRSTPGAFSSGCSASVSGGTAPFSYSWSPPGGGISMSGGTGSSVGFSYTGSGAQGGSTCTVTDANGLTGSASVGIDFEVSGS